MSEHFSLWQKRCLAHGEARNEAEKLQEEITKNTALLRGGNIFHEKPLQRALICLFAYQYPECSVQMVDEWRAARHVHGFFLRLEETIKKEKKFLTAYLLFRNGSEKHPEWTQEERVEFRKNCLRVASCETSEGKFLRELVPMHGLVMRELRRNPEMRILETAKEIAKRQGINEARFLALLPVTALLDLAGEGFDGAPSSFESASLLIRFAEREYASFPSRQKEDELMVHREQKEAHRARLVAAGLGPDEWFVRLNTPYGKERGTVVAILDRFVRGVEDDEDMRYVGRENAEELRARSTAFRELK